MSQENTASGPWWRGLTRYQLFAFAIASSAWFFDCFDQQIFNLTRGDAMKALAPLSGLDPKVAGGYAQSCFLIGWGIGGIYFGALGDRLGRARILTLCIFLYAAFTGLSAFSTGVWDFCAYRVLTGIGVGGVFGLAVALVSDVIEGDKRPKALGTFQALSTIGNIGAGAMALGAAALVTAGTLQPEWSWKALFLVGAIPALITGFIALKLREPQKWIEARAAGKEKGEKAGSYLVLLGDSTQRKNALLGLILCSAGIIGLWGLGNFQPEVVTGLLKEKYSADGLLGKDLEGAIARDRAFAFMAQNLGGFFGMLALAKLAQVWGRRPAFALGFISATLATMLMFKAMTSYDKIWWIIPLMGAAQYSLFAGYAIYLPELFPSSQRATGVSFCYNIGRFVAATAPVTLGAWTAYLSKNAATEAEKLNAFRDAGFWMSLILLTGLLVLPFLPETKGKPLPE
ncbi:MAG: putative sialic acid transporter [Verrucomicrobiota bacterium]|jgi:MFS family permease